MKLVTKFRPKNLFKPKKSSSFNSSNTTSLSSSSGLQTPTSVLPTQSHHDTNSFIDEHIHFFRIMDKDSDGKVTRFELESLLSKITGIDSEEVSLMIDEIDADGDGMISLEEFEVISEAFGPVSCDDELRGVFEFFDADSDGFITADELFQVFKLIGGEDGGCTLEECRRMISGVDKNGDGVVCFQDFARMMMELHR